MRAVELGLGIRTATLHQRAGRAQPPAPLAPQELYLLRRSPLPFTERKDPSGDESAGIR